ncbi:MAG: hypothetical protein A2W61_05850 [Deltaproteobacteria bacterium RIFCSPLOWO2_01_44_7]|nr:MAG: hypothetical protein A2712_04225 [Deltaproteobacteria bacterium RIFCSPHIGHO2_01_FULL_43_49]OGQ16391.1 MAG: hypothetical protein A3D22_02195 [Deltaproteobacteria bacterium RIFCSPHIGHO2_02_FULL_44_53]OGQ27783.1 MAG: hypothetical protein A3D98_08795 [Deltaproteobacteria bacterium RIFCSPHIGHO2_12_FULL_44_21]OGQ32909.1 MAG: hypothetical protein A2979_10125 [Deltaproteobacteria bacterium RIFCSPLOWO2_01_FULL_45_74]OGQ41650.1 MAG: hypothetical protein A2W61_05850 [Deltaproteobacteria bacterium 
MVDNVKKDCHVLKPLGDLDTLRPAPFDSPEKLDICEKEGYPAINDEYLLGGRRALLVPEESKREAIEAIFGEKIRALQKRIEEAEKKAARLSEQFYPAEKAKAIREKENAEKALESVQKEAKKTKDNWAEYDVVCFNKPEEVALAESTDPADIIEDARQRGSIEWIRDLINPDGDVFTRLQKSSLLHYKKGDKLWIKMGKREAAHEMENEGDYELCGSDNKDPRGGSIVYRYWKNTYLESGMEGKPAALKSLSLSDPLKDAEKMKLIVLLGKDTQKYAISPDQAKLFYINSVDIDGANELKKNIEHAKEFSPERAKEINAAIDVVLKKAKEATDKMSETEARAVRAEARADRADAKADRMFYFIVVQGILTLLMLGKQLGWKISFESALEKFGRDLTDLARQGKLDQVIGRDNELFQLGSNLQAGKKANAMLLGPPGVGKTAIVEKLAHFLEGLGKLELAGTVEKLKDLAKEASTLSDQELNERLLKITEEMAKPLGKGNAYVKELRKLSQEAPSLGKDAFEQRVTTLAGKLQETIEAFKDNKLVEINVNKAIAGTKYRGEFEANVNSVIDEVQNRNANFLHRFFLKAVRTILPKSVRNALDSKLTEWEKGIEPEPVNGGATGTEATLPKTGILKRLTLRLFRPEGPRTIGFIDEIDKGLKAGGGTEGGTSLEDILRPILSRRGFSLIGATLWDRYAKHIQPTDLARRFRTPIDVQEPSLAETVEILRGVRVDLEHEQKVKISDDAIKESVRLSEFREGNNPDKAYTILEDAALDKKRDLTSTNNNIDQEAVSKSFKMRQQAVIERALEKAAGVNEKIIRSPEEIEVLQRASVYQALKENIANFNDLDQAKRLGMVEKIVATWNAQSREFRGSFSKPGMDPDIVAAEFVDGVVQKKVGVDPEIQVRSPQEIAALRASRPTVSGSAVVASGSGPTGPKGGSGPENPPGGTPPTSPPAGGTAAGGGTGGTPGTGGPTDPNAAPRVALEEAGPRYPNITVKRTVVINPVAPRDPTLLNIVKGPVGFVHGAGVFIIADAAEKDGLITPGQAQAINHSMIGGMTLVNPYTPAHLALIIPPFELSRMLTSGSTDAISRQLIANGVADPSGVAGWMQQGEMGNTLVGWAGGGAGTAAFVKATGGAAVWNKAAIKLTQDVGGVLWKAEEGIRNGVQAVGSRALAGGGAAAGRTLLARAAGLLSLLTMSGCDDPSSYKLQIDEWQHDNEEIENWVSWAKQQFDIPWENIGITYLHDKRHDDSGRTVLEYYIDQVPDKRAKAFLTRFLPFADAQIGNVFNTDDVRALRATLEAKYPEFKTGQPLPEPKPETPGNPKLVADNR